MNRTGNNRFNHPIEVDPDLAVTMLNGNGEAFFLDDWLTPRDCYTVTARLYGNHNPATNQCFLPPNWARENKDLLVNIMEMRRDFGF